MKDAIYVITILIFSHFLNVQLLSAQESFIFVELDQKTILLWLDCQDPNINLEQRFDDLQGAWFGARKKIRNTSISHFDNEGFIEDQELRLRAIQRAVQLNKRTTIRDELMILLHEFREVRTCFTTSEYLLDDIMDTYITYLELSEIVHDPMMGLYEWSEFIWLIDQVKCKVETVETQLVSDSDQYANRRGMKSAIDKVNYCLKVLDESVQTAYQPNFELPCDETGDALIELIREFATNTKYRL